MTTSDEIVVEPLDREAQRALRGWLADAHRWGIDVADVASIENAYEGYLLDMLQAAPKDRQDPTNVLTMIGMALGEHIVRHSTLHWRIVTDDKGRDLALASPDDLGVLYPVDPVADAWSQQITGWMQGYVEEMLRQVGQLGA